MYSEDELLPISALQHLAFCERQAALIHIEGLWEENVLTVEGHNLHENAHDAGYEAKGDARVARGLRVRSLKLGLVGAADVVEFKHAGKDVEDNTTVELPGLPGRWKPFIIEYKRGKPKVGRIDEVQLCAQAMCLEEMLDVSIPAAAFFYGQPRRRHPAELDSTLRAETEAMALRLHEMVESRRTPPPPKDAKCRYCSLRDVCLPGISRNKKSIERYLKEAIAGEDEG